MGYVENEPVATGNWGGGIEWELFQVEGELPDPTLCTAVGCVAIQSLQPERVVIARNNRGWEILSGHIDPGEDRNQALAREAIEEGGFIISKAIPFLYRKVTATTQPVPGSRAENYPYPVSYMIYYVAYTKDALVEPTGEEILETRSCTAQEAKKLIQDTQSDRTDCLIIDLGLTYANK